MKKILVLGATGAMATYLVPLLLEKGMAVTGVSLDEPLVTHPSLRSVTANALDMDFLTKELAEGYDAIVDFMIYNTKEKFGEYYKLFLENTTHYLFFSTYRIYAGDHPIREDSLRLLEAKKPDVFVTELEYSIYKAEEEDMLRASGYQNYTIVRPAITYSQRRFQLTILEGRNFLSRMRSGKTVLLPDSAMDKQATMSWAGDVARMLSAILLNPKAYGETYTVSTAEHQTWREIAEMYSRIGGLVYKVIPEADFLAFFDNNVYIKQQLLYDRCFDRVVDNTKILDLMGARQEELMPLEEGLRMEYERLTEEDLARIGISEYLSAQMDAYLEKHGLL